MKNFNIEIFIEDLSEKVKNFLIQNTEAVDSQFDKFILILSSVINQHTLFKRALQREKQLQQKPLLT